MIARSRVFLILAAMLAVLMLNVPLADAQEGVKTPTSFSDNLKSPQGNRRAALRKEALRAQMQGKTTGNVYQSESGKAVELAEVDTDLIWTVVGEFGNNVDPTYGGQPGPKRNQIPEPNRRVDNTTIWKKNFTEKGYEKLLFSDKPGANSMRNYYLEQSAGMYTVGGDVTDWVQVQNNEAYYGSNSCGSNVCARTWLFIQDSLNAWYQQQVDAGMSDSDINAYLAQFDVWDRYDYDGDSDFNEPDGYIDHFQSIHAGEGEETGGGAQGADAIWSHRWAAFYNLIGSAGPAFNKFGGTQIGNSDYWVFDYTIEPENGGLGVFAHEFAHDLGIDDYYDTSGNTGGAENSTGFWTLMSSGSYGSSGKPRQGIGSRPTNMGALEKYFLGWTNAGFLPYGSPDISLTLAPAEGASAGLQTLIIPLPDNEYQVDVGDAYAGDYFYDSGSGNNLDNNMVRQVTLPAGTVSLSAKVRYSIEEDWDYAYLRINGTEINTNLSTNTDPNGQNFGYGITGDSDGWVDLTADLSAYAGQTVDLEFRYWTDVAVVMPGISIDEIAITGLTTDGAETDPGWTYDGFVRTDGQVTQSAFNAYLVENRQYKGYDKSLQTGPYNFGFLDKPELQNYVEHFPYQDGMLVWYYNEQFADNNVGQYCAAGDCGGIYLPVDAHPNLLIRPDGQVWRPRVQSFDSTFGLQDTDKLCLSYYSDKKCYGPFNNNDTFNDLKSYWVAPKPNIGHLGWSGVDVPKTGTKIKVTAQDLDTGNIDINVSFQNLNK